MRLAATLALLVALALAFSSAVEHVQLPVNGSAVTGTDLASADCGASTSELLTWGLDAGVIDAAQHSRLLTECQRRVASYEQQPGVVREVITAVSSRFTLINVLYFFGALLVIGAMTLFMTIGWESFGGWGIFVIATLYGALFALMGSICWNPAGDEGWNLLGGLLYTMAISMTPLAVYGIERGTGLWGGNNPGLYSDYYRFVKTSWLPMEIGTCLVGAVTLYFVRFPFLTMPVAFTLWFMSMDIVPVIFSKSTWNWNDRARVSMYFGAVVLAGACYVDRWLGCSQDFAFWFYLSGLLTFWGGLTFQESKHEAGGVIYLAINVSMLVYAQLADRLMFTLFGFVGVVLYCGGSVSKIEIKYTMFIYMRGLLGVVLLLAAHRWNASMPYWTSLAVIGCYNYLIAMKGLNDFEFLHILRLLVNFGLYEGSAVFAGHKASLVFFDIDAQYPLALVAGLSMLAFHVPVLLPESGRAFVAYRLLLCYVMMYGAVYYPGLLFLGALGVSVYVARMVKASHNFLKLMRSHFMGLSLVVFSQLFHSLIVYYMGVAICAFTTFIILVDSHRWLQQPRGPVFCAVCFLVVLMSVLFESQTLLIVGGVGVFWYLSYLAHNVFRNSLLFPFALTAMGLGVLFMGIQYQKHHEALRSFLLALLPAQFTSANFFNLANVNYGLPAWTLKLVWLPSAVEQATSLPDYAFLAASAGFVGLVVVFLLLEKFFLPPIERKNALPVGTCEVIWPQDTSNHGLTFRVRGFKPKGFTLSQAYLYMEGDQVWRFAERNFNHTAVTMFRYAFHPLKLCPSYMDPAVFKQGKDDFTAELNLGTGHNGTPRVSHATLLQRLAVMRNSGDWNFSLQVVQRSGFLWRNRQLLFEIPMSASQLVNAHNAANHRRTLV